MNHLTICIEDTDSLAHHIMEQKRGASASIAGHSNDNYQDIFNAHSEAITSIMSLCNLIAIASLPDKQFMGVSHGYEIVFHLVRHQLEMNHSKVMI